MARPKTIVKKKPGRKEVPIKVSLQKYFSIFTETEILQIEYMLNHGDSYDDIIQTIKEHFKKLETAGHKYLISRLQSYKKHILMPKLMTQVENVDVYKELLSLKTKVDSLKEFTGLVLTQKKRLERALRLEIVAGTSERFARQEVKLMADILEKLAKIQMETGVLARAPRVLSGEFMQDEEDPTKIAYHVTESFMKALDDIETEFSAVPDAELVALPRE